MGISALANANTKADTSAISNPWMKLCMVILIQLHAWEVLGIRHRPTHGSQSLRIQNIDNFAVKHAPRESDGAASTCRSAFPALCKFVDELPMPASIDVSDGRIHVIGAYKIRQKLHRDLPATTMYGYGTSAQSASSPGPTLEAKRNIATRIQWENHLYGAELLPIDPTLAWAAPKDGAIPMVTHLHGSVSESASDGHPQAWFTFKGEKGPAYNKSLYIYSNMQAPTTLWYHDHVLGITRIHVYSGLAGFYLLREAKVEQAFELPSGKYEISLAIQDKLLNASGSLFYNSVGIDPEVHPNWSPEALFQYVMVNGKLWPYLNVEKRRYRLRLLNGANGRFFDLRFVAVRSGSGYGNGAYATLGTPPAGNNLTFHQIGTDAGYLDKPVAIEHLLIAPGERADIIVDFSRLPSPIDAAWEIYLTNAAVYPYPGPGTPPDSNTVVVMKFYAAEGQKRGAESAPLPKRLARIPPLSLRGVSVERFITLQGFLDVVTGLPLGAYLGNLPFLAPATETPKLGTTETWTIVNVNNDAHPIHVHLVRHRIVSRRAFDPYSFLNRTCSFTDPRLPNCWLGEDLALAPGESGWKDTSVALPYQTTTLLLKFASEEERPFPFDVSEEPGYVWHCHVLEHEDNELMRPLVVMK